MSKEISQKFYNYYLKTGDTLSVPDWTVTGTLIEEEEDPNKIITDITITGNFVYSKPSDDWVEAQESYQTNFQTWLLDLA